MARRKSSRYSINWVFLLLIAGGWFFTGEDKKDEVAIEKSQKPAVVTTVEKKDESLNKALNKLKDAAGEVGFELREEFEQMKEDFKRTNDTKVEKKVTILKPTEDELKQTPPNLEKKESVEDKPETPKMKKL